MNLSSKQLNWLYKRLNGAYGDLAWWPAQSRFEVVIGAILVQNTAWANVEKAITCLRELDCLSIESIHQLPVNDLAQIIRPAGTFNIKAQRLKNLCNWWLQQGGFEVLDEQATGWLREGLLGVHGIGPETADAILLYAFKRPVFVIDAYLRRLLLRLGWLVEKQDYEQLRAVFERTLKEDADYYGQYHALIVEHAKQHCRSKPICSDCVLKSRCTFAQDQTHE